MERVAKQLRRGPLDHMHGIDSGSAFCCLADDVLRGLAESVEIHGTLTGIGILVATVASRGGLPRAPNPEAEWCAGSNAIPSKRQQASCFAEDQLLGVVRGTCRHGYTQQQCDTTPTFLHDGHLPNSFLKAVDIT